MNEKLKLLTDNNKEVWTLLKSKYKLFHLSNVFFRDLHYGVMSYLQVKGVKHGYADAEKLTKQWIEALEKSGLLKRIDGDAYMLNNPEFKKPAVKPAVAAKPAAPRPIVANAPAVGTAQSAATATATPAKTTPAPSTPADQKS